MSLFGENGEELKFEQEILLNFIVLGFRIIQMPMWLGFYIADVYSGVRVFNGDTDIDAVILFCFFYSEGSGEQLLEGSLHPSLFCCW